MEWAKFNNDVPAEQKGHYLPILIKGAENQEITTLNISDGAAPPDGKKHKPADGELAIAFWLDGTRNDTTALKPGKITVTTGEGDKLLTYTIDFSKVVLLPQAVTDGSGNKTEVKVEDDTGGQPAQVVAETKNSSNEVVGSVGLPADTEGLGSMTIEVKPATAPTTITAGEAVQKAIKAETTKVVEVTIKVTDEAGNETEQFAGKDALKDANIVITIGGLTSGATYHVFSIDKEGKVTSYGYKTLAENETSIPVKSKHLTYFAAAKVTDAFKTEDVKNDSQVDKGDETASGLTASAPSTPKTITATFASISDGSADAKNYYGGKLTLSSLDANKKYLVRLNIGTKVKNSENKDVVPCACYVITGETTETVNCVGGSYLTVFEFDSDEALNMSNFNATYFATDDGLGTAVSGLNGTSASATTKS